jgi:hypothetical protein
MAIWQQGSAPLFALPLASGKSAQFRARPSQPQATGPQTLLALDALDRRKPQERRRRFKLRNRQELSHLSTMNIDRGAFLNAGRLPDRASARSHGGPRERAAQTISRVQILFHLRFDALRWVSPHFANPCRKVLAANTRSSSRNTPLTASLVQSDPIDLIRPVWRWNLTWNQALRLSAGGGSYDETNPASGRRASAFGHLYSRANDARDTGSVVAPRNSQANAFSNPLEL